MATLNVILHVTARWARSAAVIPPEIEKWANSEGMELPTTIEIVRLSGGETQSEEPNLRAAWFENLVREAVFERLEKLTPGKRI